MSLAVPIFSTPEFATESKSKKKSPHSKLEHMISGGSSEKIAPELLDESTAKHDLLPSTSNTASTLDSITPIGFIFCTFADMYKTEDEIESEKRNQAKAKKIDAALDMAFRTNHSPTGSFTDTNSDTISELGDNKVAAVQLSPRDLGKLSISDTQSNSRTIQSLLFLRLIADQTKMTIERMMSDHTVKSKC